jgi:hypothetical protein
MPLTPGSIARNLNVAAPSIVRDGLIASSLFQRSLGRCEYPAIEFEQPDGHRLEAP